MRRGIVARLTMPAVAAVLVVAAMPRVAFALAGAPDVTWGVNGKVYAMAHSGDTMFAGGTFTRAVSPTGKSLPVSRIAAFSISTGTYLPGFAAAVSSSTGGAEIDALAVSADGTKLYLGRKFDSVDGQARNGFAAVDVATGTQVDPTVNPGPNGKVLAIVASPALVYFGGLFTTVGGLTRTHLAAISATDGSLSATWTPSATAGTDPCPSQFPSGTDCGPTSDGGSGTIHSLALSPDGGGVYVGGNFYYINGTPRNALAEVSATDGSLLSWRVPWHSIPSEGPNDPYTGPNVVWAIVATSTRVYEGDGRTPNGMDAFTTTMSTSSGECATLDARLTCGGTGPPGTWNRSPSLLTGPGCSRAATSGRPSWTSRSATGAGGTA